MKQLGFLIGLICVVNFASGQTTTRYGSGAGSGGSYNAFFGQRTGGITTGSYNAATGAFSLYLNTTGQRNASLGYSSLRKNTTGSYNVATGFSTLYENTSGNRNVASGYDGLRYNTTGDENTATGYYALRSNTTGEDNLASGSNALKNNTIGGQNVAIGAYSLYNNVAGSHSTSVGFQSGVGANYDNVTCLGSFATATASDQVRIGANWATSIGGYQNWTNLSDGRFKRAIKEDVLGLDFVKALRPVSYYVDHNAVNEFLRIELEDKTIIPNKKRYQTGFIAQEVEATAKELGFEHFGGVDIPENEKSHYGLRYAEFVVPLVKSVQELSAHNDELRVLIEQQQIQIDALLKNQQTTLDAGSFSTPAKAKLYQNIPNPFNNETQIKLFIPEGTAQALLQICTIDGKQLFVKEVTDRAETTITVDGKLLEAGIYLYTLIIDNEIVGSKKMVLTK